MRKIVYCDDFRIMLIPLDNRDIIFLNDKQDMLVENYHVLMEKNPEYQNYLLGISFDLKVSDGIYKMTKHYDSEIEKLKSTLEQERQLCLLNDSLARLTRSNPFWSYLDSTFLVDNFFNEVDIAYIIGAADFACYLKGSKNIV